MTDPSVGSAWNPIHCEGTPSCPPRCPRFVTVAGMAIDLKEHDPPLEAGRELPGIEPALVGPDDLVVSAAIDGTLAGAAWIRRVESGTRRVRIVTKDAAGDEVPAELARQVVAYALDDGADRLVLDRSGDPFEAAGIPTATTEVDDVIVPLLDPRLAAFSASQGRGAVQFPRPIGGNDATADDDHPGISSRKATDVTAIDPARAVDPPPTPATGRDLSGLFAPDQVALVGATEREGAIGQALMTNLEHYPGTLVPVTPRTDEVFGRPAPDSLADVEDTDLAVVAVPRDAALEAVETAAETGIENLVVVSAGFEEAGDAGAEHARRLRRTASANDLNLIGPNSMGVMSTASGLNASFTPRHPPRGGVSLLSQSGAFITSAIASGVDRGLGFRHIVSIGNKAVLDETDLLQYLDADPATDVIAAYLEDVADGEQFVEVARSVTRSTPVVILKSGRTAAGAEAAASHTGSLTDREVAVNAAFDRAGVVRAESTDRLLDYAAALRGPGMTEEGEQTTAEDANGVGIVTNAGGPGVLASDAVAGLNLSLAAFDADTTDALEDVLPDAASAANPVDVLGDAGPDRFGTAIDAVLGDPGVDLGLLLTTPHPVMNYADLVGIAGRNAHARETPVLCCLMDADVGATTRRALRQYRVPNYPTPERAAAAAAAIRTHARLRDEPTVEKPSVDVDRAAIRDVVGRARRRGRTRLGVESLSLLSAAGIDVPEWGLADSPAEAGEIAKRIDADLVLKVASPDIAHKADVGGVRVGVAPGDAVEEYDALTEAVTAARPDARLDGVLVQAAAPIDRGVETVLGVSSSSFGSLVAFGLGGVFVEHIEDVTFELAPVDRRKASEMLDSIDAAPLLRGARGAPAVEEDALANAIVRVSALAHEVPEIAELDVNPLIATPDGATAVDLQVELDFGD
jgi:acyl-CoA synthetase (NDP forming)